MRINCQRVIKDCQFDGEEKRMQREGNVTFNFKKGNDTKQPWKNYFKIKIKISLIQIKMCYIRRAQIIKNQFQYKIKYIINMSESQSSSSSHSNSKQKPKKCRVIPVMQPVSKVRVNTKQIIINLSMTHYDVITDVAEELQWRIQYSNKKGDWDVMWVDHMIEPDTLIKMHFFQKISHFPGIYVLARKNLLGLSFTEMAKRFPNDYNFFPKTWLLPSEFPELRQQIQRGQQNNQPNCFIVKPEADCQGRGIFLTFKTDQVQNGKHYVVQKYLSSPCLVEGLKFDFRVYVLLCGTNPMRLYVYEQGLARFATQKYQQPSKSNIKKMCMHLTNYAVNKKSPKYIFNTSIHNMHTGHKRTLTSVFKNIQRRGINIENLKRKIDDILIKTIIMGQPLVSHQYKFAQPDDQYRNMCFHILGIDVMLDQLLDPYVLEVNHTPSFATDTPLDYFIKFNLIKDTLTLMNINQQTKKQLVKKTNSYQRQRVINAKRLIQNQQQRQRIKQAQAERDAYENAHLGRYRKVYPVADQNQMEKYSEFLKYAQKTYFSQNNVIRSQIQSERQKYQRIQKQRDKCQKQRQKVGSFASSNSKKIMQKRTTFQITPSTAAKVHQKYRSHSERQIQQNAIKNSSMQLFPKETTRQARISSLINNPLNSYTGSPYANKINFGNQQGIQKIIKSNSEIQSDQLPSCNRQNLVKNLPKIQHVISPIKKSSTIEIHKNKFMSMRRKKMSENKDQKIRENLNRPEFKNLGDQGAFLTPKILKFNNEQQQLAAQKSEKMFFAN